MYLLLLSFLSIILYLFTPIGFSNQYTICCLIIFILSTIKVLYNNCKHNLVKFEFFFLLALFFSNYVYTVVFYQVNPYFSLFNLEFNEDYISKGLALSTVGVCFFNLGIYETKQLRIDRSLFPMLKLRRPLYLLLILMAVFLPYLLVLYKQDTYTTEFESSLVNVVLVFLVYYSVFTIFKNNTNVRSIKQMVYNTIKRDSYLLVIGVYLLLFLAIGSRTIPLRIIFLSLFLYIIYIKPINKITLFLFILLGALLMTFVGVVRSGASFNLASMSSIWDIGKDLVINNRSLYVLVEYADVNGCNFGTTMLMNILSVVPFLQSFYFYIMGGSTADISSASLVTNLYYEDKNVDKITGLGTNIIGDIYVSFGLLGVIVFMYFLGKFLRYLYTKICKGNDMAVLVYALIFMDVIYLPRSAVFTPLRSITWVLVIHYVCSRIYIYISKKN